MQTMPRTVLKSRKDTIHTDMIGDIRRRIQAVVQNVRLFTTPKSVRIMNQISQSLTSSSRIYPKTCLMLRRITTSGLESGRVRKE